MVDQFGRAVKLGDIAAGGLLTVFPGIAKDELKDKPGFYPEPDLQVKGDSTVLLIRLRPGELKGKFRERHLLRPHRVLEDLHPRRLPGVAVRAADAPPALPVPPVDLRRDRRRPADLRARRPAAAAIGDKHRRRGILHREGRLQPACRTDLLGARMSTLNPLQKAHRGIDDRFGSVELPAQAPEQGLPRPLVVPAR